jgi:hypothetical protein
VRDTAHLRGEIRPLSSIVSGLLTLTASSSPRPLPDTAVALGQSEWAGMSGAPVFASGKLVGIVCEHAPRQGPASISVTPITHIDGNRESNLEPLPVALEWWHRIGVDEPRRIPIIPRKTEWGLARTGRAFLVNAALALLVTFLVIVAQSGCLDCCSQGQHPPDLVQRSEPVFAPPPA